MNKKEIENYCITSERDALREQVKVLREALERALPVLEMRALEGPAGNSVAAQIRDEARAALSAAKERK